MRAFILFCCVFFLVNIFGCKNGEKSEKPSASARLKTFRGFPPGIHGCSCYFSTTEKNFRDEKYIFVSNLDSLAYVSINGKMTRLKLASTTREPGTMDERDYQETYTDGIYTVVISLSFKGNVGDEVWWNTGNIRLFFKGEELDNVTFLGECGC